MSLSDSKYAGMTDGSVSGRRNGSENRRGAHDRGEDGESGERILV